MTERLIIRDGSILVGNPLSEQFVNGDLLIEDGKIVQFGGVINADADVINVHGAFVLPGFVDCHHHLWEASMRGLTADWDIKQFMAGIRNRYAKYHAPEDIFAGTFAGAVAAMDCGITTSIDYMHCVNSPEHAEASVDALTETGIRSVFCYGLNAVPLEVPWFQSHEERLADARRLKRARFSGNSSSELVTFGIAASDIGSVPAALTDAEFSLAGDLDVLLTVHTDCLWGSHFPRQIQELSQRGLLSDNQLYAHANRSTNHELMLLADAGAAVASTPEVELQMGNGFPITSRASRQGVISGLGSNIQANNSPDAFTQMRLARTSITAYENQPVLEAAGTEGLDGTSLTCAQALFHATLDGARALGIDAVTGSIEVGKAADLIVVRNDRLHHRPIVDPISTIVTQTRVEDVVTVIINGRPVKQGGRMDTGLVQRSLELTETVYDRVRARISDGESA
jgi:5-methylthioadenosine/S-adenosylhomocysteine deaminase